MKRKLGEKKAVALSWWSRLDEKEQDKLIELLYSLDLQDFVEMDKDGNIIDYIT
jgi:hypothetical protein